METIVPIALMGGLLWKVVDFLKFARAKDWNAVFTMLTLWAGGLIVTFLFAESQWANIGILNLSDASGRDLIIFGLSATSLGAMIPFDFKKAIDQTDSAKTPPLTTL